MPRIAQNPQLVRRLEDTATALKRLSGSRPALLDKRTALQTELSYTRDFFDRVGVETKLAKAEAALAACDAEIAQLCIARRRTELLLVHQTQRARAEQRQAELRANPHIKPVVWDELSS